MKRVATALVLIPVVLVLVLRAPVWLLAGIVAGVALLGVRELLSLSEHYNVQPIRWPTYAITVIIFAAAGCLLSAQTQIESAAQALFVLLAVIAGSIFILLAAGMKRQQLATAFPAAAASLVALTYVALPLALLLVVRELWAGGFLVLYLLLVVWAGDTFAYYFGRALGRHKLAPRISPGKTWEGTAASFVGSIAVGWAIFEHAPQISRALYAAHLIVPRYAYFARTPPAASGAVLLSAGINMAAQMGDLVESLIKRGAGVKDSGSLLPGHGGILDRIDALLFAAPVLWYYTVLRVMAEGHF